jgi:hypothetical protein
MGVMSNQDPRDDAEPHQDTIEDQEDVGNGRRNFLRTTVAAALGVGAVAVLGESTAAASSLVPAGATTKFTFDSKIVPAALTTENIKKITDAIAAALAEEAKSKLEAVTSSFHIRIGGGHSRVFSKTSEHKNVGHSEVIIDGSFP